MGVGHSRDFLPSDSEAGVGSAAEKKGTRRTCEDDDLLPQPHPPPSCTTAHPVETIRLSVGVSG